MIARSELERLARQAGVALQVQERDYIQQLTLATLSPSRQALVFKGGTALRIVYGSNRYSEDLDFNAYEEPQALKARLAATVGRLEAFGLPAAIKRWRVHGGSASAELGYAGPLFDGRSVTRGSIRIDVSLRGERLETTTRLVKPPYPDVVPFLVETASLAEIAAEKVRALLIAPRPRHLYDLWLLKQMDVGVEAQRVRQKLALYDRDYQPEEVAKTARALEPAWERDLAGLLPQLPPFAVVIADLGLGA